MLKGADEDEIYRIARQTISRDRVSRDKSSMKDLQAHSDHVRQNDISSQAIGKADRQDPWKPVIGSIEDNEDYQPNAYYAHAEDEKPLEKASEQSQIVCPECDRIMPFALIVRRGVPTVNTQFE